MSIRRIILHKKHHKHRCCLLKVKNVECRKELTSRKNDNYIRYHLYFLHNCCATSQIHFTRIRYNQGLIHIMLLYGTLGVLHQHNPLTIERDIYMHAYHIIILLSNYVFAMSKLNYYQKQVACKKQVTLSHIDDIEYSYLIIQFEQCRHQVV